MSYVFNNEIKYSDSGNLDAFGRLRVSQTTTLLDVKHLHDKLPLFVDEVLSGSGTSSFTASSVSMQTSSNNSYVIRQTIKAAPYQSGKSQLVECSFSNFAPETNVTKRVGYYTSGTASTYSANLDGFFLESDGTTDLITFQIWKTGTNILSVGTSSWYSTDYDVNLIDWSLTQLMFVDFQWLGVGRLRFYMVIDGLPRLFYAHTGINNLSTVYMDSPNQPIRYEIRQSGVGSGSFDMICAGVSMEGSINSLYRTVAINDFTERTLPTAGTTYAMLGVRLNSTTKYKGTSVNFSQIDILQTSNDNYLVTVQKAPKLSSTPSWTSLPNTPLEYAFGIGTVSVVTSGFELSSVMGKSGALSVEKIDMSDSAFSLGYKIDETAEEWWICIQATSNNAKMRTGVNLKYYR